MKNPAQQDEIALPVRIDFFPDFIQCPGCLFHSAGIQTYHQDKLKEIPVHHDQRDILLIHPRIIVIISHTGYHSPVNIAERTMAYFKRLSDSLLRRGKPQGGHRTMIDDIFLTPAGNHSISAIIHYHLDLLFKPVRQWGKALSCK